MLNQAENANRMPPAPQALAEAYIPMQNWGEVFPPEEGTRRGTIFPSLYRPYEGRGWQ